MPLVETSTFAPSIVVKPAIIQTILPSLARRVPDPGFRREVIELPDGDFLELDWLRSQSDLLAIVNHGLEGSTESGYVRGMAHALRAAGYDVLTWNMRGCGSERNRLRTWYHSGQSEDLRSVVNYALNAHRGSIVFVGFSVGGNILLKFLGEEGKAINPRVKAAVAISVPMDLAGSAAQLARPSNAIYMNYLLKPLRARILEKAERFPGFFDTSSLARMKTFHEFDTLYTAPLHGFASVEEYWAKASSLGFLDSISVPTLAVSALDDPFLSPGCFPVELARKSTRFFLELPKRGGHVGFITSTRLTSTWVEERAVAFLNSYRSPQSLGTFRVTA